MSDTQDTFNAPSPFETIEDFFALADEVEPGTFRPVTVAGTGVSKWEAVFSTHPRGGGPFGGRDNAATAFTGFVRAKRIPLEAARAMAVWWDQTYCDPPLGARAVEEKLNRAWVRWEAGGLPDLTPEEVRGEGGALEFMTLQDMAAFEGSVGALKWLLDAVLPEGGLVYFSAPPEGGKTWLLLDLVRAFVMGEEWIGKYPLEKRNVLYIDEEMGVRKALPRLRKLGVPDNADGLWYTNKVGVRLDNPAHLHAILRHVEANGISVVFIDTLTRVHGMDENDNSQMRELFRRFAPLLEKNVTVIVAHHDRKKGADSDVKHERMRGAGEIAAMADMTFAVDRIGHMFRLSTSKGRLVAEDEKITVDFVIEDNAARTATALREVDATEKQAQRDMETEGRILAALIDGPMSTRELHAAVKARRDDVTDGVKRMAADGRVNTWKDGQKTVYGLPGQAAPDGLDLDG